MPIARVNLAAVETWTTATGTTYASPALSVTAGNALVVVAGGNATSGQSITGVTDTAGNTYTKAAHLAGTDSYREEVWYATNVTGHATNVATVTWSAAVAFRAVALLRYSGFHATPFDGSATGTAAAASTSVTTSAITTTRSGTVHLVLPRWGLASDTPNYQLGFVRLAPSTNLSLAERFVSTPYLSAYLIGHTDTATAKLALAVAFASADGTGGTPLVTEGRLSQVPLEAALLSDAPILARVSQLPIEILVGLAPTTIAAVSQAPVEIGVLSDAPISLAIDQLPIELLVFTVDPGWRLTIDGVNQTARVDSFSYSFVLNERGRATLVLGDVLPEKLQEVVSYAKNGYTPLFGGVILSRAFAGRNQYDGTYQVTCECGDWFTYADWATVSAIYDTPVTLKAVLQGLVTDALGAYGIVLHPGQVDGPILAPFLWRGQKVSDALRELSERTKYVARISPAKVLRMFLPGTDPAPVTITEAAPHIQELRWADSDRAGGAPVNKVTIICGPTGQREVHDERHYGDGVRRIWPLYAPFVAMIGALHIFSEGGGGYPVGIHGVDDMPYTIDLADNSIYQRATEPLIASGDYLWLWYFAEFPFQVTATTGVTPVIEHTESRTDILSIPAGQEVANAILTQFGGAASGTDYELAMTTDEDGFEVGQALTVTLPTTRSIEGEFVITELGMTIVLDTDQGDAYWQYQIKAGVAATVYQGSYLEDWRRIVAQPSIITEVAAEATATRTLNRPRRPQPTEPIYRSRYIEPGPAIVVRPPVATANEPDSEEG